MAGEVRRAGGHADSERACPQLYEENDQGVMRDAILDVVYHTPGAVVQRMIDVTVRCPHAQRYGNASGVVTVAAGAGEKDKQDRYGDQVMALAFKSYGRLGFKGVENLWTIAGDSALLSNGRRSFSWYYNHLRFLLERSLAYEIADNVLLSLGHSAGFSNWRVRAARGK